MALYKGYNSILSAFTVTRFWETDERYRNHDEEETK